ncbi:deSI-like protein At4g17486 isoform X2 [Impatiens glandulifera]|uniref:deSI-like protein At4g17486 isoform X2 n=1 Tax=Impatiens glandulifera TaxID=253017 RepID=UPI001FB0E0BC|nr:deSI-like protein At4g17486 isoform X2 [Impatiens glandulifera]XP_047314673.1 deSI-like protein At4g17486 isoform X2 [Impatiens glandulifera]
MIVSVHGVEYAFGAHDYPTTGIFEGEPRQCDGFTFRKAILIGWTEMGPTEVRRVMEGFADVYKGNAYNLITKNCNHFCNDACLRLTGNPIPSWVNRLARIGFICHCIVPVSLNTNKVRHHRIEDKVCEPEKKKLSSNSNRFTPSTTSSSSSSSSSPRTKKNRSRRCGGVGPHSSPLVPDPPMS